jgi:hypothetical protein
MKKSPKYLLFIFFALFSLLNSVFAIHAPIKSASYTSVDALKAPPQYKRPKMSFWQTLITNKRTKKLKANQNIDLDKTAKSTKFLGGVSIPFLTIGLVLLLLGYYSYSLPTLILGLIALVISGLLGLIATYQALLVLDDAASTAAQKEMAEKGKRSGAWGLGLAAAFFIIGGLYFDFLRNN